MWTYTFSLRKYPLPIIPQLRLPSLICIGDFYVRRQHCSLPRLAAAATRPHVDL